MGEKPEPRAKGLLLDVFDNILKWLVSGLLASALYMGKWALNSEQRIHDLEEQRATLSAQVAALEAKDGVYQQIRLDLAVVQSSQNIQGQTLNRMEALVLQVLGGGRNHP